MIVTKKQSTRVRKRSRKSYRRDKRSLRTPPRSPSKLWLFLLMMFFSTQYVASAGLLDQEFNDVYLAGDYPDRSALEAARFRRETNKLNTALQTLQPLARVTNGIALEIGLVTGEFKSEDVVRELLHMGQLTIKDITDLKKDSIEKVLAALGKNGAIDKGVSDLENRLVSLEDMREIAPKFADVNNVAGQTEYADGLEKVRKLSDLSATVSTIKGFGDSVKTAFNSLKKEGSLKDAAQEMGVLLTKITKLETAAKSFDSVIANITEAKKLDSSFIQTLIEEEKLRTQLKPKLDYDASIKALLENFNKIYESSKAAISAHKDFESIQQLVESRGPLHRQFLLFTSGLVDGSSDLTHLAGDIDRISKDDSTREGLMAALKSLDNLSSSLKIAPTKWDSLKAEYDAIRKVISHISKLEKVPGTSESTSGLVDQLKTCDAQIMDKYPSPEKDKLDNLSKAKTNLTQALDKLSTFDYISEFKNLGELKKDFDTNGKTGKDLDEFVQNTLEKLKTDEKLKSFEANLSTLLKDIDNFLEFIKNPTQGVDMTDAKNYLSSLDNTAYKTFLTCMRDIDSKTFPVKEVIQLASQSQALPDAKNAISEIINSGISLKSAQSSAEKLKNNADLSPEASALKTAFGKYSYKEVSHNLGMGVQGLLAIQKARNANLGELVGKAENILNLAKNPRLSKEHQTSLDQLKQVKEVLGSIDGFLKTTRRRRAANGFQDFQKIFTDAQNVQGTKLDMKTLREAMDALNKLTPLAPAAMSQLDDLEALDLDFARFKVGNAVGSLKAMDEFFMSYAQHLAATKAPPTLQPSFVTAQPGRTMAMVATEGPETTTESPFYEKTWFYIVCAVVGIVAVIITIVIIYCCCCKPKVPPVVEPLPDIEDGLSTIGAKLEKPAETPVDPVQSTAAATGAGSTDQPAGDAQPSGTAPGTSTGPAADAPQGGTAPGTSTGPAADAPQGGTAPGTSTGTAADAPEKPKSLDVEKTQPGLAVSDEDVLNLVKKCTQAIRCHAKLGTSPQMWANGLYTSLLNAGRFMMTDENMQGSNERRYDNFYCIAKTMAKITDYPNPFINCNEFNEFGEKKLFASQGPMDGTEGEGKKDTREKHMAMIHQNDIGVTVQLCQRMEMDLRKGVETVKCAQLYSEEVGQTVKNGIYSVKTVGKHENPEQFTDKKNFVLFNLESTNTKTGKMHKMDTLLYKGWVDQGAPHLPDPALEILRFMDTYQNNALVHCSAGVGRTGSIISIKYGIEECQKKIVDSPIEFIGHIRSIRYGCVQSYDQFTYVILCVTKALMLARGIEFCAEYYEMEYYHQQCVNGTYDKLNFNQNTDTNEFKAARIDFLNEDSVKMEEYVERKREEYEAAKKAKQEAEQAKQQAEETAKKAKEVEQAAKETEKKPSSTMSGKKSDGSKKSGKKSKDGSKKLAKKDKSKTSDVQKPGKKKDRSKQSKETKSKVMEPAKGKQKKKGSKSTPSKEKAGAK